MAKVVVIQIAQLAQFYAVLYTFSITFGYKMNAMLFWKPSQCYIITLGSDYVHSSGF